MPKAKAKNAYFKGQDGTNIWYQLRGEGPINLVLCDGLACTGYIWKYFLPHFAQSARVLHSQYRGHGHSDIPRDLDSMNVEQLAHDVLALMQHLDLDGPTVLVGHSMGVQVALEAYRQAQDRVHGLILINGPFGEALRHVHNTPIFADALPTLKKIFTRWNPYIQKVWQPLLDSELSYLYARTFEVNPWLTQREDFRVYFRDLGRMDPQVYLAVVDAATQHSAADLLPHIDAPVLVVAGDKDRFTPYPVCRKLYEAIPKAELMTMPTGSHIGPLELPEYLHLRVEKFLLDHGGNLNLRAKKSAAILGKKPKTKAQPKPKLPSPSKAKARKV